MNQRSETRDPWFGRDKLRHMTASLLATLSAQYVLTEKVNLAPGPALGLSAGSTAAAGVGKEWHDRRSGRFFSVRDLAADALGIGLAAGIILL